MLYEVTFCKNNEPIYVDTREADTEEIAIMDAEFETEFQRMFNHMSVNCWYDDIKCNIIKYPEMRNNAQI